MPSTAGAFADESHAVGDAVSVIGPAKPAQNFTTHYGRAPLHVESIGVNTAEAARNIDLWRGLPGTNSKMAPIFPDKGKGGGKRNARMYDRNFVFARQRPRSG